jgi:predicted dienelactone hydrolase
MPPQWRTALAHYQGGFGSTFLARDPAQVHAHSISNATVSPAQQTYPVIIMRSGIGALSTDYTTLAEDLASHGYIVVGMDAPYSTSVVVFSDGRVVTKTEAGNPSDSDLPAAEQDHLINNLITIWSADTSFVLDQLEQLNRSDPSGIFTHRLNLQAVGVFGHSFGGATAAQFCHDDSRCKAGIDLDGAPYGNVIQQGLHRPFMFLLSDHGNPTDVESRTILNHIQSIYSSLPSDERFWASIRGTSHFNFSDQALLRDNTLSRLAGAIGSIDPHRGLAVTAGCILQFFDHSLKGKPTNISTNVLRLYPEVQIGTT